MDSVSFEWRDSVIYLPSICIFNSPMAENGHFMGEINNFNSKEESYDIVVLSEVRNDQSVDFYIHRLVSIGLVVGEIWGEDSL